MQVLQIAIPCGIRIQCVTTKVVLNKTVLTKLNMFFTLLKVKLKIGQ